LSYVKRIYLTMSVNLRARRNLNGYWTYSKNYDLNYERMNLNDYSILMNYYEMMTYLNLSYEMSFLMTRSDWNSLRKRNYDYLICLRNYARSFSTRSYDSNLSVSWSDWNLNG